MNLFGTQPRALALAGVFLGALAAPTAFAAPADVALLNEYIGTWKGSSQITRPGGEPETVVCRMTFADGTGDKINFNGRCSLAGNQMSVSGTIAYVEAKNRYEAAMSSNVQFTGLAIGVRKGNSIVFDLQEKNKDEEGKPLEITSKIVLANDKIGVDFKVVFVESGDSLSASIPFTK